jgi:WD40 repeat protein
LKKSLLRRILSLLIILLHRRIALLFILLFISPIEAFTSEKPQIFVQRGHSNWIRSVAFSPDGRFALSGSDDKTLKLWDINAGKEIKTFYGHLTEVRTVALSFDGRFALSGSGDNTLKLWDIKTGKEIRTFSGHSLYLNSVAFSPDGRFVLSGSLDTTMKLWDAATGKEVRTFAGHSEPLNSVAFSPDGRFVLSGSLDKTMKLWDAATGKEVRTFSGHSKRLTSVAFSPDGNLALSGSEDNTMKLWDTSTGREIRTFSGHSYYVQSVAFSPDGRFALSGSYDKTMKLWEISTGREIRTFAGYKDEWVQSVAFSPDGRFALSGSIDHTLQLWDATNGKKIRTFTGHSRWVQSVAFSPDGRFALSGSEDNTLKLWDISTGKEIKTFTGHKNFVESVTFSPDGRFALSGSADHTLKLWDIATGKEIRTLKGHSSTVKSVAFGPDGRSAISAGSSDYTIKLWDIEAGKEIRTLAGPPSSNWVHSVAFSPDGRYALASQDYNILKLWDISAGKEIRTFTGHLSRVTSTAFSPNGKFALSGSYDNTIRLWDINTGKSIRTFVGHSQNVLSVAFSPDGRFVLSGSSDGTIKLWNTNTAEEIATLIKLIDGEWIVITPEGYFNASPNGAKYLNVRIGNQVYSIDNFYEKFFNPVYVASVLQGKKIEDLADIRKGIMTPPDVQITSPKANETISSDTISVSVSAKDTGGGIDEIRLYHNGKAIGEETRAVKIVSKGKEATKTYIVTLIDGINTFRAVGFSKDRTESNPYELIVHLSAPQKDISMHVLAVGINKYRNPALNLNYAVPDAKGIADFFREKGTGLFKKVAVTDVYDESATQANITAKMKSLENTNPQDVVLIYLAGHGENISDKWYFIPYELAYPEREDEVKSKGISSDDIAGLIRNIKAQKVLVMIDSCKAGAMLIAMRGFEDRKALSQLSRSTGVHVIAASTKDQFAAEVKELGHGVFTYTLLEGLKGQASTGDDKTVTVRKLMTHVENRLPDITMKYRNEAQFPVVDSRGMDFPLIIVK